jgi:hypothetical protein
MRRRDFTVGLLLATAVPSVSAQEPAKQHRIAIIFPVGPVADISETGSDALNRRFYHAFFEELWRLGDGSIASLFRTSSAIIRDID